MKNKIISKVVLLALSLGTIGASVGIGLANSKSEITVPVTFVASDASGYNTTVTIGNYSYKFKGSVSQNSNKFSLIGTVQGRASSGGNSGGGGFPGGGFPGGGDMPGGGSGGEVGPTVAVESVSLTLDKEQAYIGESVKATATILPENASTKDVEWSSSDESIATVSSGTITTLKEGVVTITATTKDGGKTASKTLTVVKEDYTPYEVSIDGTYEIEPGYGYILHLNDEKSTTIHCDYNKTEGRHEFYYNVKVGESSSFIKFQAKDAKYKSKLAKGYKTWDVRDSKYVFTAKTTGNNNSVAYAYMYLHTDGSVVVNTPSGTKRVVESEGLSWEEENNTIVVSKGNETYIADKAISTEHPGYKISYGSYVFLNSQSESVKWKNLTVEDFEGKAVASFNGRYEIAGPGGGSGEVTMSLYDGGIAKLYKNTWNLDSTGTWTKNGDEYVVTFGEGEGAKSYASVTEDGAQFITYVVSAKTPWGSDASTEVRLEIVK